MPAMRNVPPKTLPLPALRVCLSLSLSAALWACAGTDPGYSPEDFAVLRPNDLSTVKRDLIVPMPDLTVPPDLTLGPDMACALGTPDHCGTCMTVCPPGMDSAGTIRSCSGPGPGATCDYQCGGEFYDVNGKVDDGCESSDTPVQDSPQSAVAVTLQDLVDPMNMKNPVNLLGKVYSDSRTHAQAPAMRVNGREDWYVINAIGKGDPNSTMVACLSITSLPADNQFEVCISDIGKTTFDAKACGVTAGGMSSVCVKPPALSDSGSPIYVRVRKMAGTPSVNGYALFLNH